MKFHAIALALAVLATPALATTTATVSASGFDTVLKDLNTTDAVAPAITWDAPAFFYGSIIETHQTGYSIVNGGTSLQYELAPWSSQSFNDATPAAALSATTGSGVSGFGLTLDATGHLSATVQVAANAGQVGTAWAQFQRGFWLTAGTQVSFSAVVDRYLAGPAYTGNWTPPAGLSGIPGHAWAGSSVTMSAGSTSASLGMNGGNGFISEPAAFETVGEADQLKLVVRNATANDQFYAFNFFLRADAQQLLDPAATGAVPEPGTYALMALGLLGVGAAARRRKA